MSALSFLIQSIIEEKTDKENKRIVCLGETYLIDLPGLIGKKETLLNTLMDNQQKYKQLPIM